jgi:site-specific recombinase XerD
LDQEEIRDGTPFLIAPDGSFDETLNMFFLSFGMVMASPHTQEAAARDLARFLDFLWFHRPSVTDGQSGGLPRPRTWRDAVETDRRAFEWWRCRDESGPLVAASTWDREVASVSGFYRWALRHGHITVSPIAQRRPRDRRAGGGRRDSAGAETAAEYRPDRRRDRVEWLTPRMYRSWRDVGVRGYHTNGLADARFRGRNIARNAVFCDLMVRTGLRLQEQASLTIFDVPRRDGHRAYYRWWLPAAIAKYGSARSVYTPDGVLRDLWTYLEVDRAEAVQAARDAGRYERIAEVLVEEPTRASVRIGGRLVGVDRLDPQQRRRLLVRTGTGLEPAALWLGEDGMPLGVRAWKSMFRTASERCRDLRVDIYCHAHLLRHTFAVTTLEHLQRGHLAVLGEMNPQQRRHYQMVFGDPLDWIRRRLGHRSIETTAVYLHVLAELEMQTRLALVADAWEDPRLLRADDFAVEEASSTGTAVDGAA